ncbi:MAG: ATP-dependent DNA helicase PcrA [Bacillota bacterium]|nr:MAG: ATP-dependent DNA helicase PcrA [Bacillota bacterium]
MERPTIDEILKKLNPAQLAPVRETEGAILVIAGAGSGKTRVLTSRIAYLVLEKGVSPSNILAITFTNKAANEMKERLSRFIGDIGGMWVSTIHSMCVRILRQDIARLDEHYNGNFTIYDDNDKERVLKRLCTERGHDDEFAKKVKFHIGTAKNKAQSPEEYEEENVGVRHIDEICKVYAAYEDTLYHSNAMDFDDLLVKTYRLLASDKDTLDYYAERFRYVHVDEFQDTNRVQFKIVELLAARRGNLFVVGDDDQSIYGWRGAEIRNILEFGKNFAGVKTYKLEQNYRSTKKILRLANAVIANNTERNVKELWTENGDGAKIERFTALDENDEAAYTALQIKKSFAAHPEWKAKDYAVLMRVNAISRAFEQEFNKYGIPYRVFGGFKFFERKEIKDCLAYLKLLNNPLDDEALLRVINTPKRGIGGKSVAALESYAKYYELSLFDAVCDVNKIDMPAGAKAKIGEFKDLIVSLIVDKETLSLPELTEKMLAKTGYRSIFAEDTEENLNKRMNIDEFQNSILEFFKANEGANLSDYLNSVTLSADSDNIAEEDTVNIATVHAVKGLEFKCVFICGLEESIFPISRAVSSADEMEEERRLMYVAITRAREKLYITNSKSRFLYGNRERMLPSRFLKEMQKELGETERETAAPAAGGRSALFDKSDDLGTSEKNGTGFSSGYAENYIKRMQAAQKKAQSAAVGYKTGDKVKHVKFGEGVVIQVKGAEGNLIVDVAFKGAGIKSLAAKFAPMEKI